MLESFLARILDYSRWVLLRLPNLLTKKKEIFLKKKKKKKEISTSEVCHSLKVEFFAKIFALSRLRLIRLNFFFFFLILFLFLGVWC